MALEDLTGSSKFISNLVASNPAGPDDRREGDDHIRGVKNVLKNSFPAITGAVTVTHTQLNTAGAVDPASKVNKAGDTMTGDLTITSTSPEIRFNHTSGGGYVGPGWQRNGLFRWRMSYLGTEGGANSGADMVLEAYNDAGVIIGNAFEVNRATLRMLLGGSVEPFSNGGQDIGSAAFRWRQGWINDLRGTLTGNVTGHVTGNVTGSASLNVLKAGDTMTGALTAPAFNGPLTGNVTGSASLNVLKAGDTMTGNLLVTLAAGAAQIRATSSAAPANSERAVVQANADGRIFLGGQDDANQMDRYFSIAVDKSAQYIGGTFTAPALTTPGAVTAGSVAATGNVIGANLASFVSAELAVPTVDGTTTVSHGRATRPTIVQALLRCLTTEGGWAAGDEVALAPYSSVTDRDLSFGSSASSLYYTYLVTAGTTPAIPRKDGTAVFNVTAGNWRLVLKAIWI